MGTPRQKNKIVAQAKMRAGERSSHYTLNEWIIREELKWREEQKRARVIAGIKKYRAELKAKAAITQDTLLKRTHEIRCGVCGMPEWAENIGVWNADGTLQETGLCGECEEEEEEYICDCSVCGERLYPCGPIECGDDGNSGGCCKGCEPTPTEEE